MAQEVYSMRLLKQNFTFNMSTTTFQQIRFTLHKSIEYKWFAFSFLFFVSQVAYACTGLSPSFSINRTSTCLPDSLTITNTSTGSAASTTRYQLFVNGNFIDSSTGTSKTFYTSLGRGTYSIKLLATTAGGCKDSSTQSYTVARNLATFQDQSYAYLDTATFKNCIPNASSPDSFRVQTNNKDSVFNLHIIWGDGNSDTYTGWQNPGTDFSHKYLTTGAFNIKFCYVDTGGCNDTTYGILENERIPSVGIIGPSSGGNLGCIPNSISFVNNSSNISYSTQFVWDFDDGVKAFRDYTTAKDTFKKTYNQVLCNGTVFLEASNTCGLSRTSWGPINISSKDKALFTVDTNCSTKGQYTFYNVSTDSFCLSPDIKSYKWVWGDGTDTGWITNKLPIKHTYSTPGLKTVCLYARNSCGTDTFCQDVFIIFPPEADFLLDSNVACGKLTANVIDISTGYQNSRLWTFSNGGTSTDSITSKLLPTNGKYTITLKVTNVCGTSTLAKPITIYRVPRARFSNLSGGCVPHTLAFNNTSVTDFSSSASYFWSFGNTVTSTVKSPSQQVYTDSGIYRISLRLSDSCGVDSMVQLVRVDLKPIVSITYDSIGCSNDTLLFTNNSSNYNYVIFDYGDGTIDTARSNTTLKHSFLTGGNWTIKVKAVGPFGCFDVDTFYANVKQSSIAKFTPNKLVGCEGDTFKFTNQSLFAKNYSWYLDGSLYSTAKNPPAYYVGTDSTIIYLKLVTQDSNNCRFDSVEHKIYTSKNPVASISKTSDSACGPVSIQFTNTSVRAQTNSWQFGDGTTSSSKNPTHLFAPSAFQDTTYTTRLIVKNYASCADTAYYFQKVFPKPSITFSTTGVSGCGPLQVAFTNNSQPKDTGTIAIMNFNWNFGNGIKSSVKDSTIIYQASQTIDSTYLVKLVGYSEHGCVDSNQVVIRVYPPPNAQFVMDTSAACGPKTIVFTNESVPNDTGSIADMTFNWDFGNGLAFGGKDSSINYAASQYQDTTYTVKLKAFSEHQCVDSAQQTVLIYPKPLSFFELQYSGNCTPLDVQLVNKSDPYDTGSIADMTFLWDLGGGTTTTTQDTNLVLSLTTARDTFYTFILIGTSEHQCKDTFTDSVLVAATPNAYFSIDTTQGCGPLSVNVKYNGWQADSILWSIGNSYFLGAADTTFLLQAAQFADTTYSISLTTKTSYNCGNDTTYTNVTLRPKPLSYFEPQFNGTCSPLNVILENKSDPYDTSTISDMRFNWNLGDGITSTAQDTSLILSLTTSKDTFYVFTLIGESEHQCKDTFIDSVLVTATPIAQFSIDTIAGCGPLIINVNNNDWRADSIFWNTGNGFVNGATNTSFTFQSISLVDTIYKVSLVTKTKYNCGNDTSSVDVTLWPKPLANFSFAEDSVCFYDSVTFINNSQGAQSFSWDFGDNTASSDSSVNHLYAKNTNPNLFNIFTPSLIITSKDGCTDTTAKNAYIKPYPIAIINNQDSGFCSPATITFSQNSINANSLWWTIDTSKIYTSSHTKTYINTSNTIQRNPVKLNVVSFYGCKDSTQIIVQANPQPTADFTFHRIDLCDSGYFDLINKSRYTDDVIWTINNAGTNTNYSPRVLLPRSKDSILTHTVKLATFNSFGCKDSITKSTSIAPYVVANFDTAKSTRACILSEVNFSNTSTNAKYHIWYFGDNGISVGNSVKYIYKTPGIFDITHIAIDSIGCSDTISAKGKIEIISRPIANYFTTPIRPKMPNALVNFTNLSSSVLPLNYNWQFGEPGATSTLVNPQYTYSDSGWYTVRLIASNKVCEDTIQNPIYVEPPLPTINFSVSPSEGCGALTVNFTNNTVNATRYIWNFGDGFSSTDENPTHTYTIPGYYRVSLLASGPGGDTISYKDSLVQLYEPPIAYFNAIPVVLFLPNTTVFTINESYDGLTFNWYVYDYPAGNLIATSTDSMPSFELPGLGKYSIMLVVEDDQGCLDTLLREEVVEVKNLGVIKMPNAFSPSSSVGLNDTFKPVHLGIDDSYYIMSIYSRWGELLFTSTDINIGWDGKYEGDFVKEGVYIYTVKGQFYNGEDFFERGTVHLIR